MSAAAGVRLSIVTVCWNDLANVQRTIESLEAQTHRQGWEHVLIDGASGDGTADWYRSADFDFPHRVVCEPDKGIFDAMNKALDVVSGDYIVFMNAGDRYADATQD
jgi:glycosyltransferase involved in cell wall biosynthesis